ncbi:hypothetical protein Ahy_B07g086402 [Arachis hypogaea]|uniref:Myb/SANT-like domain-containing protein n=1 Tax=Arachis hypogaea TaxID=3818 RepID=A0A444Y9L4_ARAHY|nr:hypothetical protein Ahy_B07g086402 [Arachis hypogaea]
MERRTWRQMASTPRQWTELKNEQFVVLMEELVIEGKRADAGQFKSGAFQKLADKMIEKFHECGLTVKHIRNKHKRLKEKYMYVDEVLGCSGFGWNSQKMCVEVDSKQVLEAWRKSTGLEACSGKDAEEDVTSGSTFAAATAGGLGLDGEDVNREDLAAVESELSNIFSTTFASSSERNQRRQTATKKCYNATILSNMAKTFKAAVQDQGKHVQSLGFHNENRANCKKICAESKIEGNLLEFGRGKGGNAIPAKRGGDAS